MIAFSSGEVPFSSGSSVISISFKVTNSMSYPFNKSENLLTFDEFVDYLRGYGLELREGIDITKAREEYNNINKPE